MAITARKRGNAFNPAFLVGIVLLALTLYIVEKVFENYKHKKQVSSTQHTENESGNFSNDSITKRKLPIPAIVKEDEIVTHFAYTLSYSEKDEEPKWVAYRLSAWMVGGHLKRVNDFREDSDVPTGSAFPEDYKHSGYDRGHLCPAADMKWSAQSMSECFYMSNMTPQVHGFNDGIWAHLEHKVREWAKLDGEIYITAGPILKGDMKKIGKDGVSVPELFYKVILAPEGKSFKAIGFIIPNQTLKESYFNYAVSIDSVEHATGIDFFPLLPDSIENRIEANFSIDAWR